MNKSQTDINNNINVMDKYKPRLEIIKMVLTENST